MDGELLGVHICTLSTRMAIGRCMGNSYLKYAVSKKYRIWKIAQKSQLHKIMYMVVEKKKISVGISYRSGRKFYMSGMVQD